ncbi:MAG: putative Ig domain-containing protein, partial [Sphingomonadales bacterium]
FRVNSFTANTQAFPSLTALADGGWVVTWQSDGQDGSSSGLYGQRYSSDGSPVGDEFQVNTTTAGAEALPSVTTLADGGWLVTWSNGEIYGQRYDAQGNKAGVYGTASTEATLSDFVQGNVLHADAGQLSDADGIGSFAWQWQRSSDGGLAWLDIAGATQANYMLRQSDVGQLVRLKGSYTDGQGAIETVYSAASAPIANVNDAPVVANALPDQSVAEEAVWSYQIPAATFSDVDGDLLTYSATLPDGTPLPDWLTFDATTRIFSGTPLQNALGIFNVLVTVSDGLASTTDVFAINVTGAVGQLIDGTETGETLTGSAGADTINGLGGNDTIFGRAGDDTVNGGDGFDYIIGDGGNDILYGGADGDSIDGMDGDDILDGGDGNDFVNASAGSDVMRGGAGNDSMYSYSVGSDSRQIDAGSGDDSLRLLALGSGALNVDLGEGNDVVFLEALTNTGAQIALGAGQDRVEFRVVNGIVTITDFAAGLQGDILDWSQLQNGQLVGWDGLSNPFGQSGFLRIVQSGADTLLQVNRDGAAGNSGNFTTLAILKNVNAAELTAFNFGGYDPRVITYLGTQNADEIVGSDRDDIFDGLAGDDRSTGGGGNDIAYGGDGNDVLFGGAGDDQLYGGAGDFDNFVGGAGNDFFDGGAGFDNRVNYGSALGAVTVDLAQGTATGEGSDTLVNIQSIEGTPFNDTLKGSNT